MEADFDGDGVVETVVLTNERVTLRTGDQIRWQSPEPWRVKQAAVADLNQDGRPEVVLLVWRPFKAWPVDQWLPSGGRINGFHDAEDMSCHIILIGWVEGQFRERWAGSALAAPVKSFAVADLTGEGKQLLVALESEYTDPLSAPARRLKIWEWNGFGFTLVSQKDGPFGYLSIVRAGNGRTFILVP
jgi:hypothetical protein